MRRTTYKPGQWDDPYVYDADYQNADAWGNERWAPSGVLVDGELRTTSLQMLNAGVEEFVEHAFYEEWAPGQQQRVLQAQDRSVGQPAVAVASVEQGDDPKPTATSWKEKYSWSTAPRWDRLAMETRAYSRIWVAAQAPHYRKSNFIESTGSSLKIHLPKADLPNTEIEWKVPETWGAFERNRARAYCILYTAAIAYENLQLAYDLLQARAGRTRACRRRMRCPRTIASASGCGAPAAAT